MSKAPPINKRNVREIKVGVAVTIIDAWGRIVRDSKDRPVITNESYSSGGR